MMNTMTRSDAHDPMDPSHTASLRHWGNLPEADAEMAAQVRCADEQGQVLSYVADLSEPIPTIGLRAVDKGSPIGSLSGTDNIAVFHTERYCKTPLVIQGPGAGREVTAAGVLSDMVALAREDILS